MKSNLKSMLCLQMVAMFLTSVLAGPAAAVQEVPFKGSVQNVESFHVQFPTLFVDAIGTGEATHLRRFAVTYQVEVDLLTNTSVGSATFIAANGDSVFSDFTGQGTADPDVVVETNTIIGGTGRFAGATGSFTLVQHLTLVSPGVGTSEASIDGNIVIN
jgi:hypothetical protein